MVAKCFQIDSAARPFPHMHDGTRVQAHERPHAVIARSVSDRVQRAKRG